MEEEYFFPYHYLPFREKERFYQTRVMDWGYRYLAYLEQVAELIEDADSGSVIDVGCGDGSFMSDLKLRLLSPTNARIGLYLD